MQNVQYAVDVTGANGFDWGYTVRYGNLGPTVGPEIAKAADALLATVKANVDQAGELTAVLKATVDGAEQPAQSFKISQVGLTKIQRQVYQMAGGLLDKTEKHAKAKHGHGRK